jgi:hypothetical protein
LHEDGAAVGFGVGVFGGGGRCEFADHGVAGTGGELEELATMPEDGGFLLVLSVDLSSFFLSGAV